MALEQTIYRELKATAGVWQVAALLAAVLLRLRNRHYRAVREQETVDTDHDGVPDVYQSRRD